MELVPMIDKQEMFEYLQENLRIEVNEVETWENYKRFVIVLTLFNPKTDKWEQISESILEP